MSQKTYLALAATALATLLMVPAAASGSSGDSGRPILFLSNRSGDREIYVVNRDGMGLRQVTFNNIFERAARWSPDGTRIAFTGFVGGNGDIYTIKADGSELRRLTTTRPATTTPRGQRMASASSTTAGCRTTVARARSA